MITKKEQIFLSYYFLVGGHDRKSGMRKLLRKELEKRIKWSEYDKFIDSAIE